MPKCNFKDQPNNNIKQAIPLDVNVNVKHLLSIVTKNTLLMTFLKSSIFRILEKFPFICILHICLSQILLSNCSNTDLTGDCHEENMQTFTPIDTSQPVYFIQHT